LVEEHLAGCQDCRNLLKDMTTEEEPVQVDDTAPLKTLKKKLIRRRIGIAVAAALVVAVLGGGVVGYLTAWQYVPYSPGAILVRDGTNGDMSMLNICSVEGGQEMPSMRTGIFDSNDNIYVFLLTSIWERHFSSQPVACVGYWSTSEDMSVYYTSLGPEENTLIYGPGTSSGDRTEFIMPRQELGDYLIWAAASFVLLVAAVILFRKKETVRVWLERILLIPASYMIGHLCVKGFSVATYEYQRDLSLIVIIGVVVYVVALLGLHLYRMRKDRSYDVPS